MRIPSITLPTVVAGLALLAMLTSPALRHHQTLLEAGPALPGSSYSAAMNILCGSGR